jgi:hypothetical protein
MLGTILFGFLLIVGIMYLRRWTRQPAFDIAEKL